jgi:hypothetical protein
MFILQTRKPGSRARSQIIEFRRFASLLFLGAGALSLAACATTVHTIPEPVIVPATGKTADVAAIPVSSHLPKGYYQIIDLISADAFHGEPLDHFLDRLREKAASLGGNYVWVLGAVDDTNDIAGAPHHDAIRVVPFRQGDISSAFAPRHANSETEFTAAVLTVISGSDQPDLNSPSLPLRPTGNPSRQ